MITKSALKKIVDKLRIRKPKYSTKSTTGPEKVHGVEAFSIFKEICIHKKKYFVRGDSYLGRTGREFEPGLVRLFVAISSTLGNGSCLDVGANIGLTTLLLSSLYDHVYSFEASPRTSQILEENLLKNKIRNSSTFQFGLGSENRKLVLTAASDDASGGFLSEDLSVELGKHLKEVVDIRKGDDLIMSPEFKTQSPIKFIKIDVEGHELEVIDGLEQALKEFRPVIALEMNHWCLNAFKRISIPEFLERLDEFFSVIFAYDDATTKIINISYGESSARYHVMYRHIVHSQFPTLVVAQDVNILKAICEKLY
ncbi:FkbM family methyltransferase [cyanobiont of Ornithocercus magnificus]|nr:FkbM family methyltransferase [cyanobiont of Ornithocercus magnificus]